MISINKNLSVLKPKEFKKWFESRKFPNLEWEKEYKKIGGTINEPSKISSKGKKD